MVVKAYTYEADVHCWNCAHARFGERLDRAVDNEGNPVGVIFDIDEDDNTHCGTCGEEL